MGTEIHSFGSGPGLVVVHGSGVSYGDYVRFARALSDRCTVHLYNRRGRPGAKALTTGYQLDDDIDDLRYVLEQTGSGNVFGHSYGTLVAARGALVLPVERLALYDPVINVPGLQPISWVPEFVRLAEAGDLARGMAVMNYAMRNGGPLSGLPVSWQVPIARAFLKTSVGRRFQATSHTMAPELQQVLGRSEPLADYQRITARTLLAAGGRGPAYFVKTAQALADLIPGARFQLVPGAVHSSPNVARARFANIFASFFADADNQAHHERKRPVQDRP